MKELTGVCKDKWVDIKGYEGIYKINILGDVKSIKRKGNWKEILLKPYKDNYGYLVVGLNNRINGTKYTKKSIHRLLAEAFIPNPENLPTVDHINRNKLDNRLENLRWASYKTQNNNRKNSNMPQNLKKHIKKGKENPKSKPVLQYDLNGILINEFSGIREAERITGIKSQNISNCCKGKTKTCKKFIWKYKEGFNG